ncbi:hypothetical protein MN0502_03110 [Arthrobacter sp. MN05-02]|nr:hypothetical protein MN0502_03110 [Arthrobacter sp. MN05-02]
MLAGDAGDDASIPSGWAYNRDCSTQAPQHPSHTCLTHVSHEAVIPSCAASGPGETMTSLQSLLQDSFARRRTMVIIVALLLTALVPMADTILPAGWSYALLAAGVLLVMVTLLLLARPGAAGSGSDRVASDGGARPGAGLLLYLAPVILLNLVYPLVSPAMAAVEVGGVQLTLVVLASSITVPVAGAGRLPSRLPRDRRPDGGTRHGRHHPPLLHHLAGDVRPGRAARGGLRRPALARDPLVLLGPGHLRGPLRPPPPLRPVPRPRQRR